MGASEEVMDRLSEDDIAYLAEAMKEQGGAREAVGAMAIRQLQSDNAALRADVERLRDALKLYDNALNEALAIIGGEYGDHYGPLADMVAAAQLAALGAS